METLIDPTSLRGTEVEHVEREPEVNGVTTRSTRTTPAPSSSVRPTSEDDWRLLERPESGGLAPSFARVESGADYLAAGREAVRDGTGPDVRIDAVVRVHGRVYRTPDGRETTGHDADWRRRDRPRGGPRVAGRLARPGDGDAVGGKVGEDPTAFPERARE